MNSHANNDPDSMKSRRGGAQRDDSRMVSEHDHSLRQSRDTPMRVANLRPEQSEFRVAGYEMGGTNQKRQPIDTAGRMQYLHRLLSNDAQFQIKRKQSH